MGFRKIIQHTINEYKRNLWFILLFSAMFVISTLATLLAPTPTYVSLGGTFLRIRNLPELTVPDLTIIIWAYLFSLFIFACAVSSINIIIKANRTLARIPTELFKVGLGYALRIFFIYTIVMLVIAAINIASFENPNHNLIYNVLSFLVFMAVFFVVPAIVIDDMETFNAIFVSIKLLGTKWQLVCIWALAGLIILSLIEFISFTIIPSAIAKYVVILLNGLIIIPIFTIFQTQVYLEKYPLSP